MTPAEVRGVFARLREVLERLALRFEVKLEHVLARETEISNRVHSAYSKGE